jgi:hypothetical protein
LEEQQQQQQQQQQLINILARQGARHGLNVHVRAAAAALPASDTDATQQGVIALLSAY